MQKTLIDPLGNEILLSPSICEHSGLRIRNDDFIDDATTVIEKPALILKLVEGHIEQYYYRAVAWNHSLLIGASKVDGHLQAQECVHNPTKEQLIKMFEKGEVIYEMGVR